jgi:hypothetical protein
MGVLTKRLGPNASTDDAPHAMMFLVAGLIQDSPQILRTLRNARISFTDASSKRMPPKGLARLPVPNPRPLLCHPEYTQRSHVFTRSPLVLSANSPASSTRKPNSTPLCVRMLSTSGKYNGWPLYAAGGRTSPSQTPQRREVPSIHSRHLRLCPSISSPRAYGSSSHLLGRPLFTP